MRDLSIGDASLQSRRRFRLDSVPAGLIFGLRTSRAIATVTERAYFGGRRTLCSMVGVFTEPSSDSALCLNQSCATNPPPPRQPYKPLYSANDSHHDLMGCHLTLSKHTIESASSFSDRSPVHDPTVLNDRPSRARHSISLTINVDSLAIQSVK